MNFMFSMKNITDLSKNMGWLSIVYLIVKSTYLSNLRKTQNCIFNIIEYI